ncbi:MAG: potassium channel family protein, partial [Bacteroidota bacterium]
IIGSVMYLVEGGVDSNFTSIPRSIYWAIVTLTTVGYGDIAPTTELGQFLAAIVMIMGYAVIAVPTGIVSAELVNQSYSTNTQCCRYCSAEGHDDDAIYCKICGEKLNETP